MHVLSMNVTKVILWCQRKDVVLNTVFYLFCPYADTNSVSDSRHTTTQSPLAALT